MKRIKGIFRDTNPIDQPDETYLDARNVEINREFGTISSQKGNVLSANVTGTIIGHTRVSGNRFVIFSKNNALPQPSRIGIFSPDHPTTTYSDITPIGLDFDFGSYVQARAVIDTKGRDIVYWVDGKNPPRFMDIDNMSTILEDYDLFPNTLSKTQVSLTTVDDGGSLTTGAYWFAIAYVDEEGTRTDYSTVFGPVYITRDSERLGGSDTKVATSKRIVLSLSDIDSDRYSKLRVAVISKHDGVIDPVKILSDIPVSSTSMQLVHTGNETFSTGSLEEIVIDRAKYSKAGAIAILDDFLYLGDLTEEEEVNYQRYANGITSELHTELFMLPSIEQESVTSSDKLYKTNENGFLDPVVASTKKGFRLDDAYAFYIDFVLKSGKITKAYHIPGRGPKTVVQGAVPAYTSISVNSNSLNVSETFTITIDGETSGPITVLSSDSIDSIKTKIYNALISTPAIVSANNITPSLFISRVIAGAVGNGKTVSKTVTTPDSSGSGAYAIGYLEVTTNPFSNQSLTIFVGSESTTLNILSTDTASDIAFKIASALNGYGPISTNWTSVANGNIVELTAVFQGTAYNDVLLDSDDPFLIRGGFTFGGADSTPGTVSLTTPSFIGGIDGTSVNELSPGSETAYVFQEKAIPWTNGMAFWQNENEFYPDTEDFDIWTVDGSGNGVPTGNTLRNQKVRHHRFPGNEWINEPLMSGDRLKVYSIRFSNISVPESLRKKAVGFRIHYAKRDELNSLVLDSSVVHNGRLDSDILRACDANRPDTTNQHLKASGISYLYPFHLLSSKARLGTATHIKRHTFLRQARPSQSNDTHDYRPNGSDSFFYINDLISNRSVSPLKAFLNPISGISYVESQAENVNVSLNKAGITNLIQNRWGQQMVVVKNDIVDSDREYYACDIVSMKPNLYQSFDNQLLVDTNYYQEIDSNNVYTTSAVFGGDTFTGIWAYKTARKRATGEQFNIVINSVITQSYSNVELRGIGDNPYESFYPVQPDVTIAYAMRESNGKPAYQWNNGSPNYDNFIRYNRDFSELNTIKPGFVGFDNIDVFDFPSRIIRSQKSKILGMNFRTFLADDYIDLPNSRGKVVRLSVYDSVLIPHLERALVRTRGSEEIKTADFRAFLGTGDIFGVKPEEILYTENGEYGISNPDHALSTPFGYVFVDVKARKIHMLNGEGMKEISNNGLFTNFQQVISDSSSIRLGYDPSLRRVFVTIAGNDTYAYHPELGMWMTTHSFEPNVYLNDDRNLFTNKNNAIWKHGEGFLIYGQQFTCFYKIVENRQKEYTKNLESIRIIMDTTNNGTFSNDFITNFQITNSHQDTGTIPIVKDAAFGYLSNARKVNNEWHISGFRNITSGSDAYAWARRQRLYDKYFIINLVFTPGTSKTFKIHDVEPNLSMRSR